ncbi:hypothetical protein V7147_08655 [Bacillus sp. JJ1521]|uniref:hypothetical protein n=1 Tax=Bacillus sp. JJ1521 TaxID=3122957 RepID=UPI002FFE060C
MFDNQEIYEPLIWRISDLQKCDIHQIKLQDKCPECQKQLQLYHSSLVNGYCQHCFSWLGDSKDSIEKETLTKNEKFNVDNYKQLIQNQGKLSSFPTNVSISNLLNRIQNDLGFKSRSRFASFLGIKDVRLHAWIHRKNMPNVQGLMNIAERLDSTIYDLTNEYNKNLISGIDISKYNEWPRDNKFSKKKLEITLTEAIKSGIPKSLKQICSEGGFSPNSAKYHFPELSNSIMENYSSYQKQIKLEQKLKLKKILKECLESEEPKSLEECLNMHGIPYTTAKKKLPSLCEKVSRRYQEHKESLATERFERISNEIKDVMFGLHSKGIYPSRIKITEALSYKGLFLDKRFRNIRNEILVNLGYKDE